MSTIDDVSTVVTLMNADVLRFYRYVCLFCLCGLGLCVLCVEFQKKCAILLVLFRRCVTELRGQAGRTETKACHFVFCK